MDKLINAQQQQRYSQELRRRLARERLRQHRDDPVCEACTRNIGVQGHDLTYERLFREPLFDLVLVCLVCHEALHREPDLRNWG